MNDKKHIAICVRKTHTLFMGIPAIAYEFVYNDPITVHNDQEVVNHISFSVDPPTLITQITEPLNVQIQKVEESSD